MPTCFWILVASSPTCLWWKRGPVTFFWASATKKWTIIDWKVNVSNLRQYTVNTNLRPNGHTRAYSPGKQNWFSNRGPLPKPTTKNQTTSNRLTQSQPFHVHPNQQRQATAQPKHWALSSPCQNNRAATQAKILGLKSRAKNAMDSGRQSGLPS